MVAWFALPILLIEESIKYFLRRKTAKLAALSALEKEKAAATRSGGSAHLTDASIFLQQTSK
jgi:hypothetical protein